MMSSSDLDFSPLGIGESAQQLSRPSLSYWQDAWLRLKANRRALFSLFLVIALLLFTLVGPWLWRADPAVQDLDQISQPPGVDRSALIVEPYQPWSVGEVAGSGLRLAEPATTQAMTIDRHLSTNDLKIRTPGNLTPEQKAKWDAAYGPKNKAFEESNLQGDELFKWKYQRYVKDYLRCIDSVDENIGRLLDYLDKSGLAENTVVIYSSDQGWYLGEHGWYDKRWMYEESSAPP